MAGDAKKLQPIIVKKIKKSGHAVHGGAWKIAYADFVAYASGNADPSTACAASPGVFVSQPGTFTRRS